MTWLIVWDTRQGQTVEIYIGGADKFADYLRHKISSGFKAVSICCQG